MTDKISIQDYIEITNLVSRWSTSYDTKDWDLLRTCLAPSSRLDFRSLQGELHENLSADDYVSILIKTIGDKRLKTQHFMGAATWSWLGEGSIEVVHQMRVAHQRYTDEAIGEVLNKGHAHGFVFHQYKKCHGEWKIESVRPKLEWTEYDLFGTLRPPENSSTESD
ncbi:scytalone dehydratase [Cordyceps javanica]|uniref:Scytalone dehydratase n=1 Tax=Cordyceps javanica TaxID=43265 RepID=A0A545VJV4_9HYPO|nr:scytalone dehydratase [Cordyceps javanica]TQW01950.1 scytalone dehydratase [Cordyceps javanica]